MSNLIQKAITLNRKTKKLILVFIDFIISLSSHMLGSFTIIFYYNYYYKKIIFSDLTVVNIILVPSLLIIFSYFKIYQNFVRYIDFNYFINLFKSFVIYYFLYLFVFIFFTTFINAILIVTYQILLTFILIIISKILMRIIIDNYQFKKSNGYNKLRDMVIIYGANDLGVKIAQNIKYSTKLDLYCYIDDDKTLNNQYLGNTIIYHISKIKSLIKQNTIKQVILAKNDKNYSLDRKFLNYFIQNKIKIKIIDDLDYFDNDIKITNLKDIDYEFFLNRPQLQIEEHQNFKENLNKNILITGAGGSIGSEISQQILKLKPRKLFLLDHSELSLFNIYNLIKAQTANKNTILKPILSNICDENIMNKIFKSEKFDIVFHCAAYKHVDLVEKNQISGLINNLKSTLVSANLSSKFNVGKYVLISSDKAVFPSTLMGASKRLSEIYIQSMQNKLNNKTSFSAVRFGNVLNSSGSVIPIFKQQILSGGPVTVRNENVTRYFMTISEAVNLVIFTSFISKPGNIYILDMGDPVRIIDLAKKMINFYGYNYNISKSGQEGKISDINSIEILITSLKKTEKLHEELLFNKNNSKMINEKIFQESNNNNFKFDIINKNIKELIQYSNEFNYTKMYEIIKYIIKDHKLDSLSE